MIKVMLQRDVEATQKSVKETITIPKKEEY